jgi:hypothetical protein
MIYFFSLVILFTYSSYLTFTRPQCNDIIEDLYRDRGLIKILNCSEIQEPLPVFLITNCHTVNLYSRGYIGRIYDGNIRVWYSISPT